MDLFLPLRGFGHLQPLRGGLDDRWPGNGDFGPEGNSRSHREAKHRVLPASLYSGKKFAGGEAGRQTFPSPPGCGAVGSV